MTKRKFTYQLKWLLLSILVAEVVLFAFTFEFSPRFFRLFTSDNQFIYRREQLLQTFWLTCLVSLLFLFHAWRYNKKIKTIDSRVVHTIVQPISTFGFILKYVLLKLSFVFLVIAMAQPAFGKKKSKGTKETLELVVCIDVSNSMNVKDISKDASRLDLTKRALNQLVNQLRGERIGICIFANSAFVQLPLTQDYGAAKLFLEEIETSMLSNQGTNIKAALETGIKMFSPERTAKGIILITDGENHEAEPSEVFKELSEKKIVTLVLGIGTTNGGLVPNDVNRPELGFKKTAVGTPIHSKLNRKFLNSLSRKAGSELYVADTEFPDLRPLLTQINHLKRVKIDNLEFEIKEEQYQIPLAIAFASWILYLFAQFMIRIK